MTHTNMSSKCSDYQKICGFAANDKINLQLRKGEIHALFGENGAGKSTLMNMLVGRLEPTSGDIVVNGKTVNSRLTFKSSFRIEWCTNTLCY